MTNTIAVRERALPRAIELQARAAMAATNPHTTSVGLGVSSHPKLPTDSPTSLGKSVNDLVATVESFPTRDSISSLTPKLSS